jgi:hypothetical protein
MTKRDGRFREAPRVFDKSSPPKISLVGEKFGKLTITEWAGKWNTVCDPNKRGQCENFWVCFCECGDAEHNPVIAMTRWLTKGNTSSCGCNRRKHLMTNTRLYHVWSSMIARCTNPKNRSYSEYGGRGIAVCDLWRHSFKDFSADMGDPPTARHTLDRTDNDLGYDPSNCRWATSKQQNRNRRSNHWVEWRGENKTLAEWGEDPRLIALGITQAYLCERIRKGWDVERAMTEQIVAGKPITYQGETLTMMQWSKRLGAKEGNNIISKRLRYGWTVEQAISTPPGEKPRSSNAVD